MQRIEILLDFLSGDSFPTTVSGAGARAQEENTRIPHPWQAGDAGTDRAFGINALRRMRFDPTRYGRLNNPELPGKKSRHQCHSFTLIRFRGYRNGLDTRGACAGMRICCTAAPPMVIDMAPGYTRFFGWRISGTTWRNLKRKSRICLTAITILLASMSSSVVAPKSGRNIACVSTLTGKTPWLPESS